MFATLYDWQKNEGSIHIHISNVYYNQIKHEKRYQHAEIEKIKPVESIYLTHPC